MEARLWNPAAQIDRRHIEPEADIELRSLLAIASSTPLYKKLWQGLTTDRLEDLPVIRQADLLKGAHVDETDLYAGRRAIPERSFLYIFTPLGFTLTPLSTIEGMEYYVPITEQERQQVISLLCRQWSLLGIKREDVVQTLSWGNDPFVMCYITSAAGSSSYLAPSVEEVLGITALRLEIVPFEAPRTIATATLFKPKTIFANREHMTAVQAKLKENNQTIRDLGYDFVVLRESEPLPSQTRAELEQEWGVTIYQTLQVWEAFFFAQETADRNGFVIADDMFSVEITNQAGQHLPDGEQGYLTVTPRFVRGAPLVRYQTEIQGYLDRSPSPCGTREPRFCIE